jgi:hypothetical protein
VEIVPTRGFPAPTSAGRVPISGARVPIKRVRVRTSAVLARINAVRVPTGVRVRIVVRVRTGTRPVSRGVGRIGATSSRIRIRPSPNSSR